MTTRCLTLAILIIVLSAALATRTASAQTVNSPRVELGGTFSAILPVVAADGPVFLLGGGPRLGVNLTRTLGLQGSLEMLGPFGDRDGINGIYGGDARFAVRRGQNGQRTLSITVGLAGDFQVQTAQRASRHASGRLDRRHSGPSTAPHQRPGDRCPRPGRRSPFQPPRRSLDRHSGVRRATQRDGHPRIRWRVVRRGRLSMTTRAGCVVVCAALTVACEIGEQPPSYVIAGPSGTRYGPYADALRVGHPGRARELDRESRCARPSPARRHGTPSRHQDQSSGSGLGRTRAGFLAGRHRRPHAAIALPLAPRQFATGNRHADGLSDRGLPAHASHSFVRPHRTGDRLCNPDGNRGLEGDRVPAG